MKMQKKILSIIVVFIGILCFFAEDVYAMSVDEAGKYVSQFSVNFAKEHGLETAYTVAGWDDYQNGARAYAYRGQKINMSQSYNDGTTITGTRYWMDCVGWVSFAFHQALGIGDKNTFTAWAVPTQYNPANQNGFEILNFSEKDLKPGDILATFEHVMIYVGGGNIVHCDGNGPGKSGVHEQSLSSYYGYSGITKIIRISKTVADKVDSKNATTVYKGDSGLDTSWTDDYTGGTSNDNQYSDIAIDPSDSENFRVVSDADKVSLYKHILFTEKYNFNNIKWKKFGHNSNGQDANLKEDIVLGLKYPQDSKNTTLNTFIDMTLPYLNSWYIPLGMYSGYSASSNTAKEESVLFTYSIIRKTYSQIIAHQYDLQKYTLNTRYKEYDKYPTYSKFSVSEVRSPNPNYDAKLRPKEPKEIIKYIITSGVTEVKGPPTHYNEKASEETISSNVDITTKYYIKEAKTFDMNFINDFEYKKYSDADANAKRNPKSEMEYNTEPYHNIENEEKKLGSILGVYNSLQDVAFAYGASVIGSSGNSYVFQTNSPYYISEGQYHYIRKTWEDELIQKKSEQKVYKIDDLKEYNENKEKDDEKTTISSNDFQKALNNKKYKDGTYYSSLEKNESLNRIDFMNSNPKLFETYVSQPYSNHKYVGISRNFLRDFGYAQIKSQLQSLAEKNGGILPFAYGKSLGLKASDTKQTTTTTGGRGLSKLVSKAKELATTDPYNGQAVLHYCQRNHRFFFDTEEELNEILQIGKSSNGKLAGTDCSAFVGSMFMTYAGIKIGADFNPSDHFGSGYTGTIWNTANQAQSNGSLAGAEGVTAEVHPLSTSNWEDLQPGDILFRMNGSSTGEHVGIYVGKENGKHMQVDHGGSGGPIEGENDPWRGPYYHEVSDRYDYYIRYNGISSSGGALGDALFWTHFESGEEQYAQTGGDGGNACGRYQFDYRYAILPFIKGCVKDFPEFKEFENCTDTSILQGNQQLYTAWKAAYARDKEGFSAAQDQYAYDSYYVVSEASLMKKGIDISNRPDVIKGTVFSYGIQHGPESAAADIAAAGINNSTSDVDFINMIYNKRTANHPSYADRYSKERAEALSLLK